MGLLVFVFLSLGCKERLCLDGCCIAAHLHTLARRTLKQCLITWRAPAGMPPRPPVQPLRWPLLPPTAGPNTERDTLFFIPSTTGFKMWFNIIFWTILKHDTKPFSPHLKISVILKTSRTPLSDNIELRNRQFWCSPPLWHPPRRPRRPAPQTHWSCGGSSRRPAASNPSRRKGGWTRPPTPQRSRRRTAPRSASWSPAGPSLCH